MRDTIIPLRADGIVKSECVRAETRFTKVNTQTEELSKNITLAYLRLPLKLKCRYTDPLRGCRSLPFALEEPGDER